MKRINLHFIAGLLLVLTSCQQPQQAQQTEKVSDFTFTTSSEEALEAFLKGLDLSDVGQPQKAREFFTKAIELDPGFAMAYRFRAFSAISSEEWKNDIESASANKERVTDAERIMIEITESQRTADYNKRLALSQQLVDGNAAIARAWVMLGNTKANGNDVSGSRECYQKAVDLNPDWVVGYSSLGNSYLLTDPKDYKKAEEYLAKAVALKPNESRMHMNFGNCFRAQNNLEQARQHYMKAIEVNPDDLVPYMLRGHVNSYLGNFDEARNDYRKASDYPEYKALSLDFESFTYLYAGDYKQALAAMEIGITALDDMDLSPDRLNDLKLDSYWSYRTICLHHGEVDKLKEYNKKALPLSNQIAKDLGTKEGELYQLSFQSLWDAAALLLEGNFKSATTKTEAIRTLLEPVNHPNKLFQYYNMLGQINLKEKKYSEAIQNFDKSLELQPGSVYTKYLRGKAHEQSGDAEKANAIFDSIENHNFNSIDYALIRKELKDRKKPV